MTRTHKTQTILKWLLLAICLRTEPFNDNELLKVIPTPNSPLIISLFSLISWTRNNRCLASSLVFCYVCMSYYQLWLLYCSLKGWLYAYLLIMRSIHVRDWQLAEHMWPWSTKAVISNTGIFVAIDNNTLYGSKLIFLLCQKSLGY